MSSADSGSIFGGRGLTVSRLAIVLAVITTLFFFRDVYLPTHIAHPSYTFSSVESDRVSNLTSDQNAEPVSDASPDEAVNASAESILTADASPTPSSSSSSSSAQPQAANLPCMDLPGADKVMVLLKTGATELYQKLPTHFMTTLRCTPNYLLYSDLTQSFADVPLFDAIAPVTNHTRSTHADFKLYQSLQELHALDQDVSSLAGDSGWNLDRWKFLPMMHHAFANSPDDIDWFLMIEADTSLSWLNFLSWLPHLNASENLYMGSANLIGPIVFAHGGSGILMSRPAVAAMEAFRDNEGHETYDARWENTTAQTCCGDGVLAIALLESGTPMTGVGPIIQGDTIATKPFEDHQWCAPPVTWHHVSSVEVDSYWQFQMQWGETHGWDKPYLYKDIFSHFVAPHIQTDRSDWNNLSNDHKFVAEDLAADDNTPWNDLEDYEQESVNSPEKCRDACEKKGEAWCRQWMFMPGRCHLGKDLRLGKSDEGKSEKWTSGWIMPKDGMPECEEVKWDVLYKFGDAE